MEAVEKAKQNGINAAHYDMVFLKPMDTEALHEIAKKYKKIITVEEGVLSGGFGSSVLEFMADNDYDLKIKRIGIPDKFIEHGTVNELHKICGLDADSIYDAICKI